MVTAKPKTARQKKAKVNVTETLAEDSILIRPNEVIAMKVGKQALVTVIATLAGAAAVIDKINAVTITPPEVGTATISQDAQSATIDWAAPATGVTVTVDADNIQGDVVGNLIGVSAAFDVLAADVVTADAIAVNVEDTPV